VFPRDRNVFTLPAKKPFRTENNSRRKLRTIFVLIEITNMASILLTKICLTADLLASDYRVG
jgi:hypothetical protein